MLALFGKIDVFAGFQIAAEANDSVGSARASRGLGYVHLIAFLSVSCLLFPSYFEKKFNDWSPTDFGVLYPKSVFIFIGYCLFGISLMILYMFNR